jgi:hypothetical protein
MPLQKREKRKEIKYATWARHGVHACNPRYGEVEIGGSRFIWPAQV